jgi:hypothetical protein
MRKNRAKPNPHDFSILVCKEFLFLFYAIKCPVSVTPQFLGFEPKPRYSYYSNIDSKMATHPGYIIVESDEQFNNIMGRYFTCWNWDLIPKMMTYARKAETGISIDTYRSTLRSNVELYYRAFFFEASTCFITH